MAGHQPRRWQRRAATTWCARGCKDDCADERSVGVVRSQRGGFQSWRTRSLRGALSARRASCCINPQVEYMVTRVFAGGRLLSTAMRWATTTRGKLSISQEEDPVRHRRVLVARLSTGSNGMKVVPPLYDVVVVGCTGEWWTIAG